MSGVLLPVGCKRRVMDVRAFVQGKTLLLRQVIHLNFVTMPQRHVVRSRWRAYHWTGDTVSLARCATHHLGQATLPEIATFEQIVAASTSIF